MSKSGLAHQLPPEALQRIAERFKALSEPVRLQLIIGLEEGERTVGELVEQTGKTQANVSRQLQALLRAGILSRRKEGVSVYYQIADPAIFDLCRHVCGSLHRRLQGEGKASKFFQL